MSTLGIRSPLRLGLSGTLGLTGDIRFSRLVATFDGTGATFLRRAALAATLAPPFYMGAWIRWATLANLSNQFAILSAGRSSGTYQGLDLNLGAMRFAGSGSFLTGTDQSWPGNPYWVPVLLEFRSATDKRLWVENRQGLIITSSTTYDLTAGSPEFRIGLSADGSNPYQGQVANVVVGTGLLDNTARALFATSGADYTTLPGVTNVYPLDGDLVDTVGGADMTDSGGVAFVDSVPNTRAAPDLSSAYSWIFKQATLRTELPTVSAGTVPTFAVPLTNVDTANVKNIDTTFIGSDGSYSERLVLLPALAGSRNQLAICDGGHEGSLAGGPDDFGMQANVVQALLSNGVDTLLKVTPGGTGAHNLFWNTYLQPTDNPIEKFYGPVSIALNHLAPLYVPEIALVGLSGGACQFSHYFTLDPRVKICIAVRGITAGRTGGVVGDFEQFTEPNGYLIEDLWRMRASFGDNCRLTVCHADSDAAGFGPAVQFNDAVTLAPIRAAFSNADFNFYNDIGMEFPHGVTSDVRDNAMLPGVLTAL